MKFLIDNQLPVALVAHLQTRGLEAIHVSECGLEQASDEDIWDYAKANNCVIVSKDEDFLQLSVSDASGPQFVWVRLGNCRNTALLSAFDRVLPELREAINAQLRIVEIR